MEDKKTPSRGDELRRTLAYDRKNGYDRLAPGELEELERYCAGYKAYLNACKTERECVERSVSMAQAAGFRPFARGMALGPGDRIYRVNRGKAVILAVIGREGLEEGVSIGAAHLDSPRLDLKHHHGACGGRAARVR